MLVRKVLAVCMFSLLMLSGVSMLAGEDVSVEQTKKLQAAVEQGDHQAVRGILEADAGLVNVTDANGMTPLHNACARGDKDLVNVLILFKANINRIDKKGMTPLHYAAALMDDGVCSRLLLNGAELNVFDNQNRTPLDYATSDKVKHLLIEQGAKTSREILTSLDMQVMGWVPEPLAPLIEESVFGVKLWRIAASALILLLAFILNTVIGHYLKKRQESEDAAETGGKRSFWGLLCISMRRPLYLSVWAFAIRLLGPVLIPANADGAVWFCQTMLSIAMAVFIYEFVDVIEYYLLSYSSKTETKLDDMLVPVLRKALRVLVVIIAGLHVYQSVTNEPITTILAGLGIGGLAFALAAQDTLKNLFGFAMIVIDRPFIVGERIDFNGHDGAVESVGLRSTRLRRLDGHVVTIPNSRAADEVIHNIGRRPYIKRVMNVTITYDTPVAKIQKATDIIKELLDNHEGMDPEFPPRVYFSDLNADSLNILVLYWYHPADYWAYMDHAQKFNFELMRRFEAEGIEFAFPTQTLYLAGDPARELVVKHEGLPGLGANSR